jgi:hypothetical protein
VRVAPVLLPIVQIDGVDQDLEIFGHVAILDAWKLRLDPADDGVPLRARLPFVGERRDPDLLVVAAEPLGRSVLRRMREMHVDQHAGVAVALGDPGFRRDGGAQ